MNSGAPLLHVLPGQQLQVLWAEHPQEGQLEGNTRRSGPAPAVGLNRAGSPFRSPQSDNGRSFSLLHRPNVQGLSVASAPCWGNLHLHVLGPLMSSMMNHLTASRSSWAPSERHTDLFSALCSCELYCAAKPQRPPLTSSPAGTWSGCSNHRGSGPSP